MTLDRCQACGYLREQHPKELDDAPTCEEFVPRPMVAERS